MFGVQTVASDHLYAELEVVDPRLGPLGHGLRWLFAMIVGALGIPYSPRAVVSVRGRDDDQVLYEERYFFGQDAIAAKERLDENLSSTTLEQFKEMYAISP